MTHNSKKEFLSPFSFSVWEKIGRIISSHKKNITILIIIMVLTACVDALFPLMSRYAIDHMIIPKKLNGIPVFICLFIGMSLCQSIFVWLLICTAGTLETEICYDIRRSGFKQLQKLSLSYYDSTPVGWIMARMTSDTQKLGEIISWGIVEVIWGCTIMLAISGFMFFIHWKLALLSLSVVPVLVWVSIVFQKKILTSHRYVRKANSRISGAFNEGIAGAKTTKTLVREKANLHEFTMLTKDMKQWAIKAALFSALYLPIVLTLGSIGTGLALWQGGRAILGGVITYGTLVAFLSYTIQFFEPIREMARVFAELQSAQASAERILSMIETEIEIKDTANVIQTFGTTFSPNYKNWPQVKGTVEFNKVSFSYKSSRLVLPHFNLQVKAGETIAIVGETGSGKSTIVNLLCRFYEPKSGTILIDNVDYKKRSLSWLHAHIGFVLQTPHIFSGTIADNIKYGNLQATDKMIQETAATVYADRFIHKLEHGYNTEVGEGGSFLSTGQKQLLSFARAIITNPALLILDEATSSIDMQTEKLIQSALVKIFMNRTCFVIAHRLSTIQSADRIILLKQGTIWEEGDHVALMKKGGYYTQLYESQFLQKKENDLSVIS